MLFEPAVYENLFDLFFQSWHKPGAGMSVLDIGHTDGGIADPVVHHRVHTHSDAVLGQHLTSVQHDMTWVYCSAG